MVRKTNVQPPHTSGDPDARPETPPTGDAKKSPSPANPPGPRRIPPPGNRLEERDRSLRQLPYDVTPEMLRAPVLELRKDPVKGVWFLYDPTEKRPVAQFDAALTEDEVRRYGLPMGAAEAMRTTGREMLRWAQDSYELFPADEEGHVLPVPALYRLRMALKEATGGDFD